MILKSYFDGANKPDLALHDRIVLAAASGTSDQWDAFQADWSEVLRRHRNTPYLHTTDAISLRGLFDREKGWDNGAVDDLILDCVRVTRKHLAMPSLIPGEFRPGLRVVTLTIFLEDYKNARENNPSLPNTVRIVTKHKWLATLNSESMRLLKTCLGTKAH
jgi:hypothetical protein